MQEQINEIIDRLKATPNKEWLCMSMNRSMEMSGHVETVVEFKIYVPTEKIKVVIRIDENFMKELKDL